MTDIFDQAQEHIDREHEARQAERLKRALEQQQARDPKAPTWCMGCGDEIDARRLAALPRTTRCVQCAAAAERRPRG